jgi:hypothetical protein
VQIASRAAHTRSTSQANLSSPETHDASRHKRSGFKRPLTHPNTSAPASVVPSSTPGVSPTPEPTSSASPVPVEDLALSPASAVTGVHRDQTLTATATASGQPVGDAMILFSVVGSVNTSGRCTTNPSGLCSFTYAGPTLSGSDTVTACADANHNSISDPGEVCGTAVVTWVRRVLVVHALGKGVIANAAGVANVSFDFNVTRIGHRSPKGKCKVVDATPALSLTIDCSDVTSVERTKQHVTIKGNTTLDGVGATYQIDVEDNSPQGIGQDTFSIRTSTGYSASGALTSGFIKVHHQTIDVDVPIPTPSPTE